ncbi:MAG: glycosyltransferase [Actinomycetaceae bacterium]|nr:glycosyltransferase [Actinomycetaceae bacterium]
MIAKENSSTADAVVLITGNYPYGVGEDFICAELPFLKEVFSRVIVVPVNQTSGAARPLPEGVELLSWQAPSKLASTVPALWQALVAGVAEAGRGKLAAIPYTAAWAASTKAQALGIDQALRAVLDGQTRVVFYGYWLSRFAAIATQLSKRWPGRSVSVSRAHGGDVFEHRSPRGFLPGRRYLSQRLDKVYSVSSAGAESLHACGFPAHKVQVSRLGVAPVQPAPARIAKPAKGQDWQLTTCSAAVAVKRLDFIAEVVATLISRGRQVHWNHIGDSVSPAVSLPQVVDKLGISDRVSLLGRVPTQQVRSTMQEADSHIFINLSSSEGVPVTIMEALSLGLPVVATNVGGTGELVRGGEEGTLVELQSNAERVADALEAIFEMPQQDFQALSARAFDRWLSFANSQVNYADFARNLRALL